MASKWGASATAKSKTTGALKVGPVMTAAQSKASFTLTAAMLKDAPAVAVKDSTALASQAGMKTNYALKRTVREAVSGAIMHCSCLSTFKTLQTTANFLNIL